MSLAPLTAALLAAALQAPTEPGRFTVRALGVADGLAHAGIFQIVADSNGFLWFCTEGGLSRFDGSAAVSYGKAEGLGSMITFGLCEDKTRGLYWVGTGDGLYRFAGDRSPAAGRMFEKVVLPLEGAVRRLLLDSRQRLWIATSQGLAVLEGEGSNESIRRVLPDGIVSDSVDPVFALLEDGDGAIWAGTQSKGLFRIAADGRSAHRFPVRHGLFFIRDLVLGPDGRIWCAFFGGVTRLRDHPENEANPVDETFETKDGMPTSDTSAMLVGPHGEILVATTAGIARLQQEGGRWRVAERWTMREGLSSDTVRALAFDPAGSLWIGTMARGAMKLVPDGFRRYPGLEESASVLVGTADDGSGGMLLLAAVAQRRYRLHTLNNRGHSPLDVRLPDGIDYLGWGGRRIARERDGTFWIATGKGLLRYRAGRLSGTDRLRSPPDRIVGTADGLPGTDIFWVAADRHGALWVSVSEPAAGLSTLARREAGAERFTRFPAGIGRSPGDLATGFTEGPDDTVWISFGSGKVVRVARDGSFSEVEFAPAIDLARFPPRLMFDSRGRLWILPEGVRIADDPTAQTVATRGGPEPLRGINVYCAVEDSGGGMFFGTDRGVLRVGPEDATPRLFAREDGLPGDTVTQCEKDARGDLWFGDALSLVQLTPGAEHPQQPLQARIGAIHVDGAAWPVPPLGAASFGPVTLAAGPHRVAIECFAIGHTPGERIQFQHRFEGATEWSPPTDARTLEFPRLPPGRHRLTVRAVQEHGPVTPPAVIDLSIPAPVWQRWWFVLLAAVTVVGAAFSAYRLRVGRLLAVERVRTRIATDLHDAVGADLSRISLLADFVQQDVDGQPGRARTMLSEVARTARDAVREMSDIVWALQSKPADLSQIVGRLRDFAADLGAAAGLTAHVTLDPAIERVRLPDDKRRELYMLLKEAVINAIRHAGARTLTLDVRPEGPGLVAEVRDDGHGFDPQAAPSGLGGNGIASMHARAARLGGNLSIDSGEGRGTTVRLTLART